MASQIGALLAIVKNPKLALKICKTAFGIYTVAKPIVEDWMDQGEGQGSMKLKPVAELRSRVMELEVEVRDLSRRISLMNLSLFGGAMVSVTALVLAVLWR